LLKQNSLPDLNSTFIVPSLWLLTWALTPEPSPLFLLLMRFPVISVVFVALLLEELLPELT
jgi:hypothetical protein